MSQRDSDKGTPNEGASITTRASGIKEKKGRRHALKVPVRDEVGYKEALECGFQQEMCSFSDDKGWSARSPRVRGSDRTQSSSSGGAVTPYDSASFAGEISSRRG